MNRVSETWIWWTRILFLSAYIDSLHHVTNEILSVLSLSEHDFQINWWQIMIGSDNNSFWNHFYVDVTCFSSRWRYWPWRQCLCQQRQFGDTQRWGCSKHQEHRGLAEKGTATWNHKYWQLCWIDLKLFEYVLVLCHSSTQKEPQRKARKSLTIDAWWCIYMSVNCGIIGYCSLALSHWHCTVKPVYNDHLMEYFSTFWSSSRWPRAT